MLRCSGLTVSAAEARALLGVSAALISLSPKRARRSCRRGCVAQWRLRHGAGQGGLGGDGGLVVAGGNIGEQIARILLADQLPIRQRQKQRVTVVGPEALEEKAPGICRVLNRREQCAKKAAAARWRPK